MMRRRWLLLLHGLVPGLAAAQGGARRDSLMALAEEVKRRFSAAAAALRGRRDAEALELLERAETRMLTRATGPA